MLRLLVVRPGLRGLRSPPLNVRLLDVQAILSAGDKSSVLSLLVEIRVWGCDWLCGNDVLHSHLDEDLHPCGEGAGSPCELHQNHNLPSGLPMIFFYFI